MFWVITLTYDACMLLTLIYALAAGGSEEKQAAGLNLAASVATWLLVSAEDWFSRTVEWPVWTIDLLAVLGFAAIMRRSRRFWPMWAFAFATAGMLATVARFLTPEASFLAYFGTEGFWPYGTMLAIALGVAARTRPRMLLPI